MFVQLLYVQLRRTEDTNNTADDYEEMDYDRDDASMEDVIDGSHHTSPTGYNDSLMGDEMDFSPHMSSETYYYPQFNC